MQNWTSWQVHRVPCLSTVRLFRSFCAPKAGSSRRWPTHSTRSLKFSRLPSQQRRCISSFRLRRRKSAATLMSCNQRMMTTTILTTTVWSRTIMTMTRTAALATNKLSVLPTSAAAMCRPCEPLGNNPG